MAKMWGEGGDGGDGEFREEPVVVDEGEKEEVASGEAVGQNGVKYGIGDCSF